MADQFTETKTTGYFSRIANSFVGILVGIVLIVVSIWMLYTNEGRVNTANIAKQAIEISATDQAPDPALKGKLVAVSGKVETQGLLADEPYLRAGSYLAISRKVEMFSWVEKTKTKSTKNMGGSETTETTYTYEKGWTAFPEKPSEFKYPQGHENPTPALKALTQAAQIAKIGVFELDMRKLDLPAFEEVSLDGGKFAFRGYGSLENPQLGDLRLSYGALRSGVEGTVFGKLEQGWISPYFDKDNNRLYRLFAGDKAQALATMQGEHKLILWVMRLVGFMLMWAALKLLFEPLSVILDVLPFLGSVSRMGTGFFTFIWALLISLVVIIISMIAHNLIALIIVLALIIGGIAWLVTKRKK
jgi:hypothetical protein